MRRILVPIISFFILSCCFYSSYSQSKPESQKAIKQTAKIIEELHNTAFPEVKLKKIRVKSFSSKENFFKARFSFARFLTFRKMRHLVFVNPRIYRLGVPKSALKAILAHELAHVLYYTRKNRFQLLGLVGLAKNGFTAKFERRADLVAIERGFGEGLVLYRRWLYKNIPPGKINDKKRNYFSPDEIIAIMEIIKKKPVQIEIWKKNVPKNIGDIRSSV